MLNSSLPSLEAIDDGIRRGLRDNGAAVVTSRSFRVPERAVVETRIFVSDMVPALQKLTVTLDEGMARDIRAFAQLLRDVAQIVHAERDVRRWSYVDP